MNFATVVLPVQAHRVEANWFNVCIMVNIFIENSKQLFHYYKTLGESALSQLSEREIFQTGSEHDNSIAIIMQHLAGNMLSRWTNFFTEDGEKSWRHRDKEFELQSDRYDELLKYWERGWNCLFKALDEITADNIDQDVFIRAQKHNVTEAVQRQLTHYAYHIGQLVYIAKKMRGSQWNSLSIPKNKSSEFNTDRFRKDE